jgi:hypothetical protein
LIRLDTYAPSLAVALANALAFLPAKSKIPYAAIRLSAGGVYTSGTDSYAAGTDHAPALRYLGSEASTTALVDRDGLTELERCAREAKQVNATVEAKRDQLTVTPNDGRAKTVPIYVHEGALQLHNTIADIIGSAERRTASIPGVLCVNPAYFSRFQRVKADKAGRMADMLLGGSEDPVLIKIGPTFKGLIMPVDRATNSRNIGQEGLW